MWWLGLITAGGIALWLVLSPFLMGSRSGRGATVEVPVAIGEGSFRPMLPLETADTVAAERPVLVSGRGELRFETHDWSLQLVANGVTLLAIGVLLWGIHLLRGFLRGVRSGQVFMESNARRLRHLGWLLVATAFGAPALEYGRSWLVLERTALSGARLLPPVGFWDETLLAGLLVLVLASAWRYGSELQQDRDLTV